MWKVLITIESFLFLDPSWTLHYSSISVMCGLPWEVDKVQFITNSPTLQWTRSSFPRSKKPAFFINLVESISVQTLIYYFCNTQFNTSYLLGVRKLMLESSGPMTKITVLGKTDGSMAGKRWGKLIKTHSDCFSGRIIRQVELLRHSEASLPMVENSNKGL